MKEPNHCLASGCGASAERLFCRRHWMLLDSEERDLFAANFSRIADSGRKDDMLELIMKVCLEIQERELRHASSTQAGRSD